jgi:acetylxylan esterase
MSSFRAVSAARARRAVLGTAVSGLTVVGALAMQAAPALAVAAPVSPCAAAHVLVARASTEAQGPGVTGALAEEIQKAVKATVSTSSVVYPAALSPYEPSVTAGDTAIKAELTEQVGKCPSQAIVLLGYSQGAQIVGDVLGGGGGNKSVLGAGDGPATPPAAASVTSHVTAVIQYGDPRRIPNQSFDVGTDKGATGIFPRLSSQSIASFGSKIQSYCDNGDPFCAGGFNLSAHLDYTEKYDKTANKFVVGLLKTAGVS